MASEAVVSYIVGKLGDLVIQQAQLFLGVNEEVEWILKELRWMQCFLREADSKRVTNDLVREWVSDIRDVFYEAEDVIDKFIYNETTERRRPANLGRLKNAISKPITCRQFRKEIERLKEKISEISRRRETYGISNINIEGRQEAASSSTPSLQDRRRFSAMLEESEVVGQLQEIDTVKQRLMNEDPMRRVVSIVGMGGSGKTTLARKVYNDVKNEFRRCAFICLSQQYRIKDVLIRIIKGVAHSSGKLENLNEEELGVMLRNRLKNKRYLVVIDDIWSTEAWDMLNFTLPHNMNRSRVMLTTRIKGVAVHADPLSPPHEMRLLNDDEGWELFLKKIFPAENLSTACPSDLEETGRNILKKCGGLPLAILVLGGLLATKDQTILAWSKVLERINLHLTESSERCMDILALSYWDLPHYLKPCFLYLGIFPEDYEIGSKTLIELWIAEGFIQEKESKIMEDVAEDYLEELVSRSLVQVVERKSNGLVGKCRVHDLLRDLSVSEAKQNNFFTIYHDNCTGSSSTSVRRLVFHCSIDGYEITKSSTESLRSLLYFTKSGSDSFSAHVSKLLNARPKLLGVLMTDYKGFPRVTLHDDIGVFVHLRFLQIEGRGSCPSSIGNLSNLLTLYVRGGGTLPNAIFNLQQLRHLDAWESDIDGYLQLTSFRKLHSLYIKAGRWMEDGLDKLTNLRNLVIYGDLSSNHEKLSNSIKKLKNLQVLQLNMARSCLTFMPFKDHLHLYEMHLDGSIGKLPELPPNLASLSLRSSELLEDAISTLEKLSCLKILRFNIGSYRSKKMICSSGGFPRLELLVLQYLRLEEWIVEDGAMPCIKSVRLTFLNHLRTQTLPERVRALVSVYR